MLCFRYLQIVARRFVDDGCQHSAAALTYMTLFAVVPMMTVTFSMFSLIPAFQGVGTQVQDLIFSVFIPTAGTEVESYLGDFTAQARKLSVVGVGILVITAYLMLHNIERVFNRIWATTGPRRGVSAFLLYWAVLSLGPFIAWLGNIDEYLCPFDSALYREHSSRSYKRIVWVLAAYIDRFGIYTAVYGGTKLQGDAAQRFDRRRSCGTGS